MGNFDAAVSAAERAVKLDPENPGAIQTLKHVRALTGARTRGNDAFKTGDFSAAEKAYSEGLENPLGKENAFLLSNRAAARSKQDRWDEALSDADRAVKACPNYSKAKLRRAHAYKSLNRWGEAVTDLESLAASAPNDVDLGRELFEAKKELAKSRGEDVSGWKFTPPGGLVDVASEQQYREKVKGPGLVVGYFTGASSSVVAGDREYPTVELYDTSFET
jgi:DnaJ family protein C protein 7